MNDVLPSFRILTDNQITTQFTLHFHCSEWNATNAFGAVYAVTEDLEEMLPGMNTQGCSFTSCPIRDGVRQTYRFTLQLAKKFPVVSFDWNGPPLCHR